MTKQSRMSSEAHKARERERQTHTPLPDTTTYITKDYSCSRSCGLLGQRFPEERRDFPLIQRDWSGLFLTANPHTHTSTRSQTLQYKIRSPSKNKTSQFQTRKKSRAGSASRYSVAACAAGSGNVKIKDRILVW